MLIDTKTFVKAFMALGLSLSLGACSDNAEEVHQVQAQQSAQVLVDKQNDLVRDINSMGTPRSSWSNSTIADYERKLNQLQEVERQLDIVNGGNGIIITGGRNASFISSRRATLARIKAERRSAQEQEDQTQAEAEEARQTDRRIRDLIDQSREQDRLISADNFISEDLTDNELQERAETIENQKDLLAEITNLNERRIREQTRIVNRSFGTRRALEQTTLEILSLNKLTVSLHALTLAIAEVNLQEELDRRQALADAPPPPRRPFFGGGR